MLHRYITTTEAARILGVSNKTIQNMVAEGTLAGHKLNPHKSNSPLRIVRQSVEDLKKARGQETHATTT